MYQTKETIINALLDITKNIACSAQCDICYLGRDNCRKLREIINNLNSKVIDQ